jgi:hypothetical protein
MTPINPRHLLLSAALLLQSVPASTQGVFPGADENSPSLAHYFTWINNTNEGATAAQTQTNLAFFQWLKNDYGMTLDIHAFDAGVIDAPKYYGTPETRKFKGQFPQRFGPLAEQAKGFGGRLGVWLGPDGFGNTPREEKARIDFLTSLCRDHQFQLFKMDAVCTQLREDKQDAFVRLMESCRKHSPDLILLNHRLELGKAEPHATTFLWEGAETYIDVHMVNTTTAPHNRAGALGRSGARARLAAGTQAAGGGACRRGRGVQGRQAARPRRVACQQPLRPPRRPASHRRMVGRRDRG